MSATAVITAVSRAKELPLGCILVIDDHALVREGLAQTLSRLGGALSVIEATDAAHALALIDERDDIDLVITDLIMPGMNGFSLLATLRERDPSLPVLVVSALSDKPTVSRAMRQGASGFVSKGDSGAQLVEAVREVLDGNLSGTGRRHRQGAREPHPECLQGGFARPAADRTGARASSPALALTRARR
jgi:DNA-binding NarL/FixJ family response regulator